MRGVQYALAALIGAAWFATAVAAETKIVAIGASNTAGFLAGFGQSYPSQLEAMLKAHGYQVHVINAGVLGDTTRGMLRRIDTAVPPDARIVILQPGGNDARFGISKEERASNIGAMVAKLSNRGVRVIVADDLQRLLAKHSLDGIHFNAEAHTMIAKQLYPQIVEALGGGAPAASVTPAAAAPGAPAAATTGTVR